MWQNLLSYVKHTPTASIGAAFALMSLYFGTWITRIPDIKQQAALSEAELGLALLGMPIGAVAIMPVMGALIHRFGSGKVTWFSCMIYSMTMILPALAVSQFTLGAALVLIGMSAGCMDVAMNAAAVNIEKRYKKTIMSTSHAMFSFGAMIGAGVGSLLAGLGVSTLRHFLLCSFLMLLFTLILRKNWFSVQDEQTGGYGWTWPSRAIALLAFIGFCVLLSEGAIADWSAVYLRETLSGSSFIGGLGFAGFSMTMALGRLYGDILIPKWGAIKTIRSGGLLAGISLGVGLLAANPMVAILGFTLSGLGLSCVVPVVFSTAARSPGISPGGAIASISSMGYLGFMIGPPAIGFIAEEFGLGLGLGMVALLCIVFGILAPKAVSG